MNNPDYFQIEDPHENRSHTHEMPAEESEQSSELTNAKSQESETGEEIGQEM